MYPPRKNIYLWPYSRFQSAPRKDRAILSGWYDMWCFHLSTSISQGLFMSLSSAYRSISIEISPLWLQSSDVLCFTTRCLPRQIRFYFITKDISVISCKSTEDIMPAGSLRMLLNMWATTRWRLIKLYNNRVNTAWRVDERVEVRVTTCS